MECIVINKTMDIFFYKSTKQKFDKGEYKMDVNLTVRQKSILDFLKVYLDQMGYPPTIREICEAVGLKSTATVHSYLNKLEKLGYIKRDATKTRAIDIIEKDIEDQTEGIDGFHQEMIELPVFGQVKKGQRFFCKDNIEDHIPLPANLVLGTNNFIFKVQDNKMKGSGIIEGDYVVVDKEYKAKENDIVLVRNRGQVYIRRYFKVDNKDIKYLKKDVTYIRLEAEDEITPIHTVNEENITIYGIVRGNFRIIK